jgi:transcriptional regulator with XRE-family HTH domain
VEAASGFSSTHISEIERGRTSPTIGALIRIAQALDKDPSFFVEERELDEVCVTSARERPSAAAGLEVAGEGMRLQSLTRGILGGRLLAHELVLDPGGRMEFTRLPETGDLSLICVEGSCEAETAEGRMAFAPGDSLHLCVEELRLSLHGPQEGTARLILLMDPKEATA